VETKKELRAGNIIEQFRYIGGHQKQNTTMGCPCLEEPKSTITCSD